MARIVLVAATEAPKTVGTPPRRVFMRAKANICRDDGGFAYELANIPMYSNPEIIASIVQWGEPIKGTAHEVLGEIETPSGDKQSSCKEETKYFLKDILLYGQVPTKEIKRKRLLALSFASPG